MYIKKMLGNPGGTDLLLRTEYKLQMRGAKRNCNPWFGFL
jgi:hypothetical protein